MGRRGVGWREDVCRKVDATGGFSCAPYVSRSFACRFAPGLFGRSDLRRRANPQQPRPAPAPERGEHPGHQSPDD